MRIGIGLIFALACTSISAAGEPASQTTPVGIAQVDITPSYPIRLSGFGFRRTESEGVTQRIWAKALAIGADEDGALLLITTDNLGVPAYLVDELAARLAKRTKVSRDHLAVTATHTHTAPMLRNTCPTLFGVSIPKEHLDRIDQYTKEFTDKLESVALAALADRKPARLSWGIGKVGFAANRRTKGGPVDHDLPLLVVKDLTGKARAIYVSYACHCVTLSNNKVSGDWAGYAQQAIQDDYPGAIALVSVGCGADANPSSGVTGDKSEIAAQQGKEIANEVKRLMGGYLTPLNGKPLAASRKTIELPLDPLPTRAEWEERAKRTDAIGHHARLQLERLDRGETLRTKIDYPIQTWIFGDNLSMVFLPGEVVVDYSLRLKKELNGQRLWINAYSNDAPCYIPSERILKEGGYEGGGAMVYYDVPARLKTGIEQKIVDVVHEQVGPDFKATFDANKTDTKPLSPQQSAATLKTKPNLVVELVAAEPLIRSPVAIDWGPDGRMYVAEMYDYPSGVSGDFKPGGRVSVLEDTDGDGRYDKATVFLDNIPFPTGVTAYRKGVLICAAPDILYAADTDGDGKADDVQKLYSGFGTHNYQGRVNSLEYGLDGWIYGSCGLFGGTITCRPLVPPSPHRGEGPGVRGRPEVKPTIVHLGDRDFRIKPDLGLLEPATGRTQQGRVRDDWGNWFGCDSGTLLFHYPLEDHYLRRNPHVAPPPSAVYVPDYPNSGRLYPTNPTLQRFALSGPAGNVTGACGLGIYRDNLLGEEYRGNAFTCEPVNLLVHREIIRPKGSTFASRRADDEQTSEFLASTDTWFRPVQARTGPDGALYIVDMYRYVIEHPRWIPPADLAKLDVRAGHDMGRIYRVFPKDKKPREIKRLDRLDTEGLVQALASSNGWKRDMAMQALVAEVTDAALAKDGGRITLMSRLENLYFHQLQPESRVSVISLLDVLAGGRRIEQMSGGLLDKNAHVRRHMFRFSYRDANQERSAGSLHEYVNDRDPQVRMQIAYALGEYQDQKVAKALARLILEHADDPHLVAAALSSLNRSNVLTVLRTISPVADNDPPLARVVEQVVTTAVAVADTPQTQSEIVALLQPNQKGQYHHWQWTVLEGLLNAKTQLTASSATAMLEAASAQAADEEVPTGDRLSAIRVLGRADKRLQSDLILLGKFLDPQRSLELQSTALATLRRIPDDRVAGVLLANWKSHTPSLKAPMLDILLSRPAWQKQLLAAIEKKDVPLADIDATRRQHILNLADEQLRSQAARLFAGATSPDRAKVLEQFQGVLNLTGNAVTGKQLFAKHCANCHRLENIGYGVGPDLAAVAGKSPGYLLQEILDPNKNMDSRYTDYRALTQDGQTLSGILASENATSITLRGQEGKQQVILRTDIDKLQSTGRSLMPEGLEKDLKPQDFADLIGYLTAAGPPPKQLAGNRPEIITITPPNPPLQRGGELRLLATNAAVYGADITLEPDHWNLGYWHGIQDRATWTVQLDQPGEFDVWFDFACDPNSAGNTCALEGITPALAIKVPSTGAWSQYQWTQVGTIKLAAGTHRLTLRPTGESLRGALVDLRGIHLLPKGQKPAAAAPVDAKTVAQLLLDDSLKNEARQALVAKHLDQAPELIVAMTADLRDDTKEEYRRIPWIWRVAIAAGKRNDADQLRRILDVSLPKSGEPLRHWQAVVIGGGIVNGISLQKEWPKERAAELLKDQPELAKRWAQVLAAASAMVDDEKVPTGTRYDALRIIALDDWEKRGQQLAGYLKKGTHDELTMGAISGLSDMQSPHIAPLLAAGLGDMSPSNRQLALEALLRTPEHTKVLVEGLEKGTLKTAWLTPAQRKALSELEDRSLRERALRVLDQ